MAQFLIRIELRNADSSNYKTLHESMLEIGGLKTILDKDGFKYDLPEGTYFLESHQTAKQVLKAVQLKAEKTKCFSWIILSESSDIEFSGLPVSGVRGANPS